MFVIDRGDKNVRLAPFFGIVIGLRLLGLAVRGKD